MMRRGGLARHVRRAAAEPWVRAALQLPGGTDGGSMSQKAAARRTLATLMAPQLRATRAAVLLSGRAGAQTHAARFLSAGARDATAVAEAARDEFKASDSPVVEGKVGLIGAAKRWGDIYFELGKGKLSGLVTFTAAAGFVVATPAGASIALPALIATCAGTALSAMGASAFNQAMESSNDALMKRTARRPVVVGKLSRTHAFAAASAAGASGVALLYVAVNPLTAALAATNIVLYAGVYTPLKQVSIWNTWVGAVVGAIPPVMGWAAVTNSVPLGALAMGGILFSWQMPHFLSLAYMMRADYKSGGYLMMPGDAGSPGLTRATYACLRHCVYLEVMCLAVALPVGYGGLELASPIFAAEATILNAAFFAMSMVLHKAGQQAGAGGAGKTNVAARRLFLASLAYLPLLLGAMCVHRCVSSAEGGAALGAEGGSVCPYKEANYLIKEAEKVKEATTAARAS